MSQPPLRLANSHALLRARRRGPRPFARDTRDAASFSITRPIISASVYPVTLAAWLMQRATGYKACIQIANASATESISLYTYGTVSSCVVLSGGIYGLALSGTMPLNQWAFAAAQGETATDRYIYLNGGRTKNTDTALSVTPASLYDCNVMGFHGINDIFPGLMAHAAIWQAFLSIDELHALYYGRRDPRTIRPSALLAYWPLDGSAGPRAEFDLWGNNHLVVPTACVPTPTYGAAPTRVPHWRVGSYRPSSSWAFEETVRPNAVTLTNLTGTAADIDEDPSSPDSAWLTVG